MFEGTFHQERVGQPVSIQEQPRHPSYVLAAETPRCWSGKRQCRSILNLLHILISYWQTTRYNIHDNGGRGRKRWKEKLRTSEKGTWHFPGVRSVVVWGWEWQSCSHRVLHFYRGKDWWDRATRLKQLLGVTPEPTCGGNDSPVIYH